VKKKKPKVIGIRVPHPAPGYQEMQEDSTHCLVCEKCNARRYVDERFLRSFEEVRKETGAIFTAPVHRPCGTPMKIITLKEVKNAE